MYFQFNFLWESTLSNHLKEEESNFKCIGPKCDVYKVFVFKVEKIPSGNFAASIT